MGCGCSHKTYGDTGRAISDISWSGPQMGNRGVRFGPRRPTLDELDEPKEVLRSEVIELLSMRQILPDGRTSTIESVPFPVFATEDVDSAVLSVAVAEATGFLAANRLVVIIQNAVQTADDPAKVFTQNAVLAQINVTTVAPALLTEAWTLPVGPGARLLLEWEQGGAPFDPPATPVATVTLSVWLTLRRRVVPITGGP